MKILGFVLLIGTVTIANADTCKIFNSQGWQAGSVSEGKIFNSQGWQAGSVSEGKIFNSQRWQAGSGTLECTKEALGAAYILLLDD